MRRTQDSQARAAQEKVGLDSLAYVARHPSIESSLAAVRQVLGMDVAYATEVTDSELVLRHVSGEGDSFGIAEKMRVPLSETYCKRVLDGEFPFLIGSVREHAGAMALPVTSAADVGAFISAPMLRADGSVYGTLCAISHESKPELSERDLRFLEVLARIVCAEVERMESEQTRRRMEVASASMDALLAAVGARDAYTAEHTRAVVELARVVARHYGLGEPEIEDVAHVALLHDIGKIAIPDAVLLKPGPLDEEEWLIMQRHPLIGAQILKSIEHLAHLSAAVRAEHERWDGDGYPDGLAGEKIPVASRIVLACDALHAMSSDRPYRTALASEDALAELRRHSGSQFDPRAVTAVNAALADTLRKDHPASQRAPQVSG